MGGMRAAMALVLLATTASASLQHSASLKRHGRSSMRLPLSNPRHTLRLKGGSTVPTPAPPLPLDTNAQPVDYGENNPPVVLDNIAKFDNWDHRECCVSNAADWTKHMEEFLANAPGEVPKKIHQIWVGPRQPPIVWVDTWRKKYRSEYPGWDYKLWGEAEVAEMQMRNQDLYDEEKMYQCKADILRLEILWREGGVYIDADMVWLHKDLQNVLDACKDTGFFCGYEPDTKDKPYSVIGNSFLAATPKHPLVDMLIKYIRAVYPHKRPYHGVEWVTGPLAYTKCISHTKMPWTVPPQIWFYPKFHYVPNPDAINLNDFPDSYAFQFGYTCSGLEGWVANSIKRCTLDAYWLEKCPQLKNLDWPLGKLAAFPKDGEEGKGVGEIPKVIHQFALQGSKPDRWIKTWAEDFVRENPDWTYKCWTSMSELKGDYFCCNMYNDQPWQMDSMAMRLLSLEVIYQHGGYHVPLTSTWQKDCGSLPSMEEESASLLDPHSEESIFSKERLAKGFAEAEALRIVGCAKGSPECLNKIKQIMMMEQRVINERFLTYPDSVSAYLDFPEWTRFLGASEMWDLCNHPASERAMLSWSYDSTVPCYRLSDGHRGLVKASQQRCVVVTDPELFYFKSLIDAIPGFISSLDKEYGSWQVLLISLEYEAGEEGSVLYRLSTSQTGPNQKYIAAVFNAGWAKLMPDLDGVSDLSGTLFSQLMQQHDKIRIHVGCEKFSHDRSLANIYRAIPGIKHAFQVIANHEPPFDFDSQERSGNTLKAFKSGNTRFELSVDNEHRATYRGFNEDGAINSECRLVDGHAGKRVEWLKVFMNHQVVLEKQNVNV